MCGIVGAIWDDEHVSIDRPTLDEMTDALSHRGPDGRGTWTNDDDSCGPRVAFGHRRLSIIDLEGSKQPLSNNGQTIWITFNGEIYNYLELRSDLEKLGHQFRTKGDTETIIHLYERYGVDCLSHLRGMFAFAIWDSRRQRLFVARDRLGQKPLVYSVERDRFMFASEIKSILRVPGFLREVDDQALDDYLTFGYVPHPRSMFRGIRKLPPAHFAIWERGELTVQRYWSVSDQETLGSVEEVQSELRQELTEAVRLRMRSDVPLGAFLSGGIDSTTIVGLMREHSERVCTHTIGFREKEYDETEYAQIAANHLGTEHQCRQVEPDALAVLPKLIWHFDEPFADSSAIPTYFVAKAAREHVTVALTGDGGDELFAGYPRYQTVEKIAQFDRLPTWLKRLAANRLWQLLPDRVERSRAQRLRNRMAILREPPDRRYAHWVAFFSPSWKKRLYSPDVLARLNGHDSIGFLTKEMKGRNGGTAARLTDLTTYLPCDLLAKVDVTSMACSLECRSPFLDHRVVELAAAIPFAVLNAGHGEKPLLANTFEELIPPVLRARGKMGFRTPLDAWFRGPMRSMVRERILSEDSFVASRFRPEGLKLLLEQHEHGHWNHGDRIWSLLVLELWHNNIFSPQSWQPALSPAHLPI